MKIFVRDKGIEREIKGRIYMGGMPETVASLYKNYFSGRTFYRQGNKILIDGAWGFWRLEL